MNTVLDSKFIQTILYDHTADCFRFPWRSRFYTERFRLKRTQIARFGKNKRLNTSCGDSSRNGFYSNLILIFFLLKFWLNVKYQIASNFRKRTHHHLNTQNVRTIFSRWLDTVSFILNLSLYLFVCVCLFLSFLYLLYVFDYYEFATVLYKIRPIAHPPDAVVLNASIFSLAVFIFIYFYVLVIKKNCTMLEVSNPMHGNFRYVFEFRVKCAGFALTCEQNQLPRVNDNEQLKFPTVELNIKLDQMVRDG